MNISAVEHIKRIQSNEQEGDNLEKKNFRNKKYFMKQVQNLSKLTNVEISVATINTFKIMSILKFSRGFEVANTIGKNKSGSFTRISFNAYSKSMVYKRPNRCRK